ncbi:MAG: LysM peptidoglycan-binding domain-containing protein [Pirellulales bacterium]
MAKEVKIGLGVIGALLLVFGVVLFIRLGDPGKSVAADRSDDKKPPASRPKLASGPSRPIKVAAGHPLESRSTAGDDGLGRSPGAEANADSAPPENYMPDPDALERGRYADFRNRYATSRGESAADAGEPADVGPAEEPGDYDDSNEEFDPYSGDGQAVGSDDGSLEPSAIGATEATGVDLTGADAAELDPGTGQQQGRSGGRRHEGAEGPEEPEEPAAAPRLDPEDTRLRTGLAGESRAAAPRALTHSPRLASVDGSSRTGSYTVEPNDSFWSISEKVYGSGSYSKALEAHHREQFPDGGQIAAGDTVSVPDVGVLEQTYPTLVPKRRGAAGKSRMVPPGTATRGGGRVRVYAVQEGDTLFDIARFELGRAARWAEIYELNRDQLGEDFNYLAAGMELVLPDDQRPDPVASDPKKAYRR